jgi:DNA processing protein
VSSRAGGRACRECLLHAWLVARLAGPLDRCARAPDRLLAVLAQDCDELLRSLAGRRAQELRGELARARAQRHVTPCDEERSTCRHREEWPRALACAGSPRTLFAGIPDGATGARAGAVLAGAHAPVVAIAGSSRASEHGERTAYELGRDLAAGGALVAATAAGGIAASALAGARDGGHGGVLVAHSGLPAAPCGRASGAALVLAELAPRTAGRSFGRIAAQRTLALLASLVVVVEAHTSPLELLCARAARSSGTPLAAVPGRVGTPGAEAPNALIRGGAVLVRDAADALALLAGGARAGRIRPREPSPRPEAGARGLSADQRAVLGAIDRGNDTPARLGSEDALLHALSELELLGVVRREQSGRYVRAAAIAARERVLLDERLRAALGSLKQSRPISDDIG